MDEVFAHRFAKEHGDLFRQMLNEKPKVKHWWTNITNAVRSVFADAAKRNGVDLEGLRGLGAEEFIGKVADQLAAGKELNEWTAYGKDEGYSKKGVEIGEGKGEQRFARHGDNEKHKGNGFEREAHPSNSPALDRTPMASAKTIALMTMPRIAHGIERVKHAYPDFFISRARRFVSNPSK